MIQAVLDTLWAALQNLGWQLGIFLGPVVLACVLLHFLEKALNRRMHQLVGRSRIYLNGWIGTPVHEISHALMCWVFRHKVLEIKLFSPDDDGRLGYVRHAFRRDSLYQRIGNFFIGIAPLFGGATVLLLLLMFVHPEPGSIETASFADLFGSQGWGDKLSSLFGSAATLVGNVFHPRHYNEWRFWLFVYLAFGVGSYLAPSGVDLKGGREGALLCLLLAYGLNLLLVVLDVDVNANLAAGGRYLAPLLALLFLALVFNLVWLAVTTPLSWLKSGR